MLVLPPSGRLKINVDGSFLDKTARGGVGVVIRDADGECVAALICTVASSFSFSFSN